MNEILDMYQEMIIDHSKSPKNFGKLKVKTNHADGHNQLCGDKISIELLIENEQIIDIAFYGAGCAISKASASLMTESLKNKNINKAKEIFNLFHSLLTKEFIDEESIKLLGKLTVFSGVKAFPIRVKCATLAWHTLSAAIDVNDKKVSNEEGLL